MTYEVVCADGISQTSSHDGFTRGAFVSHNGKYRYTLSRAWGAIGDLEPKSMTFVMLNPSTADGLVDDRTITRCVGFARREKCNGLTVVNLSSYRATSPRTLFEVGCPLGHRNAEYVLQAIHDSDVVVAAWGNNAIRLVRDNPEAQTVIDMVRNCGKAFSLGALTVQGQPSHPLYKDASTALLPYWQRAITEDEILHEAESWCVENGLSPLDTVISPNPWQPPISLRERAAFYARDELVERIHSRMRTKNEHS